MLLPLRPKLSIQYSTNMTFSTGTDSVPRDCDDLLILTSAGATFWSKTPLSNEVDCGRLEVYDVLRAAQWTREYKPSSPYEMKT